METQKQKKTQRTAPQLDLTFTQALASEPKEEGVRVRLIKQDTNAPLPNISTDPHLRMISVVEGVWKRELEITYLVETSRTLIRNLYPVGNKARLATLRAFDGSSLPQSLSISDVLATNKAASNNEEAKKASDVLDILGKYRRLVEIEAHDNGGKLDGTASPEISVKRFGNGYEVISSHDLESGDKAETRYLFDRKGSPVDRYRGLQVHPFDAFLRVRLTFTEHFEWNKERTGERGDEWQQSFRTTHNFEGETIYLESDAAKFSDAITTLRGLLDSAAAQEQGHTTESRLPPLA